MPPRAEEICDGRTAAYWAAWAALTLPASDSVVPVAWPRSWRTARGSACPLNVASATASAAVTAVVSAAAMITSRCAFIRGSVSDRCAKPIKARA